MTFEDPTNPNAAPRMATVEHLPRWKEIRELPVAKFRSPDAFDPDSEAGRQFRRQFHAALPENLTPLEVEHISFKVAETDILDRRLQIQFLSWLGSATLGGDETTARSARYALWERRTVRATASLMRLHWERFTSY